MTPIIETKIRSWFWLFSGFRQDRLHVCGTELIWRALRRFAGAETCIQFSSYDFPPEEAAGLIDRNSFPVPYVVLAGYSWGFHQANETAKALADKGIRVRHLICCDGVYRPTAFWPLNVRAMTRLAHFEIPSNVDRVTRFYQTENRPAGHKLKFASTDTKLVRELQLHRTHDQMDESPEYAEACVAAAEAMPSTF